MTPLPPQILPHSDCSPAPLACIPRSSHSPDFPSGTSSPPSPKSAKSNPPPPLSSSPQSSAVESSSIARLRPPSPIAAPKATRQSAPPLPHSSPSQTLSELLAPSL